MKQHTYFNNKELSRYIIIFSTNISYFNIIYNKYINNQNIKQKNKIYIKQNFSTF